MTDEASPVLIERAKRDRAAFAEIYDLYLRRIYGFASSHSRTREEAEDLTSQTFERALKAITGYEDLGAPFSRWLFRIAANLAIDRARKGHATILVSDEIVPEGAFVSRDAGPAELTERWERALELVTVISRLPAEQKDAIKLRFWRQLSFTEIGRATGRSEQAAKQLVYRAIRTLRLELAVQEATDG